MRERTTSTSEYLAFLSAKYEVDPDEFFLALLSAEENETSTCGNLEIECRRKAQSKTIFLILKGSKVVAQFPVFDEFLLRKGHPIRDHMGAEKVRRFLDRKIRRSSSFQIKDLRSGMTQINLKAKILEISKPSLVHTRYGNYANVANALLEDETGTIKMCLWNEQISSVSAGDTVKIENARTSSYRGQNQLNVGKTGLLTNMC